MTGIITVNTIGIDITKFNLFSNINGFTSAFETNIDKPLINSGFPTNNIPNGTTIVRVMSSEGACTNYIDISIS